MKILIAMDNSECSMAAFNSVLSNYWPFDSEFEVMTVVEPIIGQYPVTISYVDAMVEAEEDLKKQAREFVKARTNELKEKFPMGRVTGTVYEGTVADTILDRAVGYNADLIVLGSHGRKGLNKFLLGSVAERVAAHAPCSVEIVKVKHENAAKEHRTMANTGKRAAKS